MNGFACTCLALAALGSVTSHAAEVDGRLLDAAARIDYGWMTADPTLIEAVAIDLTNREGDPWGHYLRAYAALRSAQLRLDQIEAANAHLSTCIAEAQLAAESSDVDVEATVLIAACSAIAAIEQPLRFVLHQRRLRQSLEYLGATAPDNPRYQLMVLQYDRDGLAGQPPSSSSLLAAFRASASLDAFPSWGEAEALVLIGNARLDLGDIRGARDLLEEALLIAPDFALAGELREKISSATALD